MLASVEIFGISAVEEFAGQRDRAGVFDGATRGDAQILGGIDTGHLRGLEQAVNNAATSVPRIERDPKWFFRPIAMLRIPRSASLLWIGTAASSRNTTSPFNRLSTYLIEL